MKGKNKMLFICGTISLQSKQLSRGHQLNMPFLKIILALQTTQVEISPDSPGFTENNVLLRNQNSLTYSHYDI